MLHTRANWFRCGHHVSGICYVNFKVGQDQGKTGNIRRHKMACCALTAFCPGPRRTPFSAKRPRDFWPVPCTFEGSLQTAPSGYHNNANQKLPVVFFVFFSGGGAAYIHLHTLRGNVCPVQLEVCSPNSCVCRSPTMPPWTRAGTKHYSTRAPRRGEGWEGSKLCSPTTDFEDPSAGLITFRIRVKNRKQK